MQAFTVKKLMSGRGSTDRALKSQIMQCTTDLHRNKNSGECISLARGCRTFLLELCRTAVMRLDVK